MGNVPISCCRSKSPRTHQGNRNNHRGAANQNHSKSRDGKPTGSGDKESRHSPPHILQHISEREPDDSDTDPSSNPLNRPIFASRSSTNKNRNSQYHDSYSSISSRQPNAAPLTSSQDRGYYSNTSTNLTQYDGKLNNSFESSIRQQNSADTQDGSQKRVDNETQNYDLTSSNISVIRDEQDSNPTRRDSRSQIAEQLSDESRIVNLLKSSSCSTIFTDGSTISQPDLDQTIKCVSLAIYYHIKNRTSHSFVEIFDESKYPLKMPKSSSDNGQPSELVVALDQDSNVRSDFDEPDYAAIYWFVKTLFKAAQLTSEYAITTLVYLERLMTYAEMDLTPRTWRRMFLGAILLSSKVWEDQAVWNVDYAQILEDISVEDINELERQFLELIQFNMNVPSSVYAKYYFHLRTLALRHGISRKHTLLTVAEAKTLEAMSQVHVIDWNHSPIQRKSTPAIKRHTSLEKLRQNGFAKAVLM